MWRFLALAAVIASLIIFQVTFWPAMFERILLISYDDRYWLVALEDKILMAKEPRA